MILARLLNLIGVPAMAVVMQTGEAVAPNLPTPGGRVSEKCPRFAEIRHSTPAVKLQPAARVHRRKVHAVARDMRRDAGMPPSEAFA